MQIYRLYYQELITLWHLIWLDAIYCTFLFIIYVFRTKIINTSVIDTIYALQFIIACYFLSIDTLLFISSSFSKHSVAVCLDCMYIKWMFQKIWLWWRMMNHNIIMFVSQNWKIHTLITLTQSTVINTVVSFNIKTYNYRFTFEYMNGLITPKIRQFHKLFIE